MNWYRWCKHCGRKKHLNQFRADKSRPKRFAADNCLRCEVAMFMAGGKRLLAAT